jgi:hypothetical protein
VLSIVRSAMEFDSHCSNAGPEVHGGKCRSMPVSLRCRERKSRIGLLGATGKGAMEAVGSKKEEMMVAVESKGAVTMVALGRRMSWEAERAGSLSMISVGEWESEGLICERA